MDPGTPLPPRSTHAAKTYPCGSCPHYCPYCVPPPSVDVVATAHCPLPTAHCPRPLPAARCGARSTASFDTAAQRAAQRLLPSPVARRPSPVARMPDAGCPLRNRRCPWCISLLSLLVPLIPRRSAEPLLEHRTPESPSGLAPPPHANNDRSARRTPPLVAPPKLWRGRAVPSSQSLVSWCPSPLKPCTCSICRRDCGSCVATRFGRCLGGFSAAGRHRSGWNSR
jgi:hypothetical protein